MVTPATIQVNPLGPSPFQVPLTKGDMATNAWNQWFTQAQQKINVINATLATLAGGNVTPGGALSIDSGGTGATTAIGAFTNLSPLTTDGDMLIYAGGNVRLPVGADGFVLQIVSGTPTWVNASAGSSPLTTKGDIYGFDTAPARIPVGANSYVLTADSTNSLGVSWKPAGTPTLPITTKGDILGYSTVPARIPIGTDGQVLTADSTQALGVSYKTPTSSSPLTTKGDLYGYSSESARIPVGTDGQVMTADSTQALGVKWAPSGNTYIASNVVTGSAVTDVTFSGLDLSSVVAYELYMSVKGAVASADLILSLYYNGDTTEANYRRRYFVAESSVITSLSSNAYIIDTTVNFGIMTGVLIIQQGADGSARAILTGNCDTASGTGTLASYNNRHLWTTVANVTSITIHCNVAGGIAVGSSFYLYKK